MPNAKDVNRVNSEPAKASPTPAGVPGRRVALIVGINDYPPSSSLKPLAFAENDAKAIARKLLKYGFRIFLFLGSRATRDHIEAALARAKRQAGSLFLFFFTGHGQYVGNTYVLQTVGSTAEGTHAIPFDNLDREWQASFNYEGVLAVLDACRDSMHALSEHLAAFGIRGEPNPRLKQEACDLFSQATNRKRRVELIFGCLKGQLCYEDPKDRYGVLAAGLLRTLDKHPDCLPAPVLAGSLVDELDAWSKEQIHRWRAQESAQRKHKYAHLSDAAFEKYLREARPARQQTPQYFHAGGLAKPVVVYDRDDGFARLASRSPGREGRAKVKRYRVPPVQPPQFSPLDADTPENV